MPGATALSPPRGEGATPHDALLWDGSAALLRFRAEPGAPAAPRLPILLVPSVINRWYVMDLRPEASLAGDLVRAGHRVYLLDWGVPQDEDRHLTWDELLARLRRAVRATLRDAGASRLGLLGYCVGGTLAGIHAALHPDGVAAFVNLAGPFDFGHAGLLGTLTDARWFDPAAIAAAGNVAPWQMQSGFVALRPTLQLGKWVGFVDRIWDPAAREAFWALEGWASDNIPFPAAAYARYVRDLYQENQLIEGRHHVGGERVDLSRIDAPLLNVTADKDTICPPAAALALSEAVSSSDRDWLSLAGGHVGAVVGGRAPRTLYPKLASWFRDRLV
ncbi:MAG TPA: alpha/beta fold hydrolase [Myxococcales bacterium]|nr:alpha/beta fold hydrolase [Myxococcales bacterium]